MPAGLKRALLVIMLCILPVQSMAFVLVPLQCSPEETHQVLSSASHAGHDHAAHAHDAAATHDGGAPHGNGDGHGHLCCHQFSTAAPAVPVLTPPRDFRVYASTVSPLTQLHIPELPQRPPRA
jgi:hypothetical protein